MVRLQFIEEKKKRNATFHKRIGSMKKKIFQLCTLCGTRGFLICYGPNGKVETWPENIQEIQEIIASYNGLTTEQRNRNNLDLASFLGRQIGKKKQSVQERNRPDDAAVDLELVKVRERLQHLADRTTCSEIVPCRETKVADHHQENQETTGFICDYEPSSHCDDSWLDVIDLDAVGQLDEAMSGVGECFMDLKWYDDPWFAASSIDPCLDHASDLGFSGFYSNDCIDTFDGFGMGW